MYFSQPFIFSFNILMASCLLFVSGCFSSSQTTDQTQAIHIGDYTLSLGWDWKEQDTQQWIDQHMSNTIVSLYSRPSTAWYQDNIIITQDKLAPNASLEDYVQAGIGGIAYTRSQYTSLHFDKSTLQCQALNIPTISNVFSIYRVSPHTHTAETIYFIQRYLHKLGEVITISASTSNKENVTSIRKMLDAISCNTDINSYNKK